MAALKAVPLGGLPPTPPGAVVPIAPVDPFDWMTENGKKAWRALRDVSEVTELNQFEFVAYCEAIGEFRDATKLIEELGMLTTAGDGTPIPSPIVGIRNAADARLARWAQRFRQK